MKVKSEPARQVPSAYFGFARTSAFPLNWPEPASLTGISLSKCEG